jgi:HTH-type transcriptional regulator/antitoxin MqsA
MDLNTSDCPICGASNLTVDQHDAEFKHNGVALLVQGLERSVCSSCGARPVMTEQIKRNQVRIADAKRIHDGLLTGREIYSIRSLLDLSQADAARVFGGGGNAFSKYERGEVIQSVPMDRLLRLIIDFPALIHQIALYAGVVLRAAPMVDQAYMEAPAHVRAALQDQSGRLRGRLVLNSSGEYIEVDAAA